MRMRLRAFVAPFAGAWIEIMVRLSLRPPPLSLPLRERGLKCLAADRGQVVATVAPFAGAWIEIFWLSGFCHVEIVAPFAGAWIEISRISPAGFVPSRRSLCGSVD